MHICRRWQQSQALTAEGFLATTAIPFAVASTEDARTMSSHSGGKALFGGVHVRSRRPLSLCLAHGLQAGQTLWEEMHPHLAALLRQNISYTPIVWSAYGRPHPDTLTVLRSLSKSIARKRNIASAGVVFPQVALEHHTGDMETQRTANKHLLACDGLSGYLGHGHLAPNGGSHPAPGSLPAVSCVPGLCFPGASWSPSPVFSAPDCLACSAHPPRLPIVAHHSGAPGAWPWCLSALCTCRLLCLWLAAHFLPLFLVLRAPVLPRVSW